MPQFDWLLPTPPGEEMRIARIHVPDNLTPRDVEAMGRWLELWREIVAEDAARQGDTP